MTLTQLKYAVAAAEHGSMSAAAKALFVSQPSLSSAIKELEAETGVAIFTRSNRGIAPSEAGEEFLSYARQVVQQAALLTDKYLGDAPAKQRFSVSTQHYTFTANAFVELLRAEGGDSYEFTLREEKTLDVIDDVKAMRSELGILYLSDFNSAVIGKILRESGLQFCELFTAAPHVFISKAHPLAGRDSVALEDLEPYPVLNFVQGEFNSFYFSEEILSTLSHPKSIKVSDRAAIVNLLIGVDAYTVSTGVFPAYLHGEDIIAVPLEADERIRVGYIKHKTAPLSRLGERYVEAIRRIVRE